MPELVTDDEHEEPVIMTKLMQQGDLPFMVKYGDKIRIFFSRMLWLSIRMEMQQCEIPLEPRA